MILTARNQAQNFQRLAVNVKDAQAAAKAQEAPKVQNETVTNPNVNLNRNSEQDTFNSNAQNLVKDAIKGASMLYLTGFCIGFCPPLFLVAAGAFLFSGAGQSFKDSLVNTITKSADAVNKFQQMQQQAAQQAQPQAAQPETVANNAVQNNTVTNPIQQPQKTEEQKPLTPFERAEQRYNRAQENKEKAAMSLQRKEEAQKVAMEKYELSKAKLLQAREEYKNAKAEVRTQMTQRMTKLQQSYETKRANAIVAKEKTDVARAVLKEADMKLFRAEKDFKQMQSELDEANA